MSDRELSDDQLSAVNEQKAIGEERQAKPESKVTRDERQAADDYRQKDSKLNMHIRVYSPFRDYFDGQAFSISAENDTGPFDILPKHHNFISLLKPCDLIIRTIREGEKKIIISGGIMHVKANQVVVFLDI